MHSSDSDQPTHGGNGEGSDGQMPGSVLLDFTTCIDERRNGTTAYSRTRDGHRIQVTFWSALPPLVSYFSIYSPDLDPSAFPREPVVIATEEDLVLLRVVLGLRSAILEPDRFEYFIYQAGGVPSLHSIKRPGPSRSFGDYHVGLLRCHPKLDHSDGKSRHRWKRSDDDGHFYIIAALGYSMVPGCYDLHTFDSRTKVWDTKTALLRGQQERGEHSSHVNSKVIVIGGEAGTMGWVDLWQGILFCDVLNKEPEIRYVSLPAPLNPDISMQGCPRTSRDIAVIKGLIRYVEFQHHILPGSVVNGNYIANGWTVSTWSRKATTDPFEEDHWQQDCRVHASQIAAKNSPMGFELLPKFFDDQGTPLPTLERLHTGHPTLSLHDDNVVYLMSKINYRDTKAWVLAVDIRNRTLQGAAKFVLRRTLGMSFAYMCSWIGIHVRIASGAGTKGNLN
ncbi:uncharacterized protein [Miscanthus floridulus]|uniref:uncharacterized protein isoform X1 n=1 Tax=Miscanthus floridulus TaxID=154761 RepID=UPI003457C860